MPDFPILTTIRLALRPMTHADAAGIMALFGSPDVLRYLNNPPVDTHDKAIGLIDWLNAQFTEKHEPNWAITLHGDDTLIGTCGTYAWNRADRHVDIGYQILPSHW